MKIALVIGTRPEAIKMAPVLIELKKRNISCIVIATAQHREILDEMLGTFAIKPDYDLNIMKHGQDLFHVTTAALESLRPVLQKELPDVVLVQGDTTTTMSASLAAFYLGIPVGHIEAGLRTGNISNPFPEEMNRRLTSHLATLHFAPTEWAKQNLLREGIHSDTIAVTGNTVLDALRIISEMPASNPGSWLSEIDFTCRKVILVTAHRRENFGEPLTDICLACRDLARRHEEIELVYPVHPNPNVQRTAREILSGIPRVHLLDPLPYDVFVHLMKRCSFILTDSGGIQEEAPAFGKPVLVLRTTSERPEAIEAGTAKLIGTERQNILNEADALITQPELYASMVKNNNPFGDGFAARRIADCLAERYGF